MKPKHFRPIKTTCDNCRHIDTVRDGRGYFNNYKCNLHDFNIYDADDHTCNDYDNGICVD